MIMSKVEVVKLQKVLGLPADGIMGERTRAYIRHFRNKLRKHKIDEIFRNDKNMA